ncbi:hypothetical protein AB205_0105940, partial [Aquarana catesbeiana]
GGDFTNHNGTGGKSIYGSRFPDENFLLKHTGPGKASFCMHRAERHLHTSLSLSERLPGLSEAYLLLLTSTITGASSFSDSLDGKHVVFGYVKEGYDVVKKMEGCGQKSGRPTKKIVIADCGELS